MFPSQKYCGTIGPGETTDLASMRPGCFHPRNDAIDLVRGAREYASMRPGCFHPRNDNPPPNRARAHRLQ